MSREEAFAKAKEARKQAKAKEGQKGNFEYEEIVYTAMHPDVWKQVRVLGYPEEYPQKSSTCPKIIKLSLILGDDGKWFRCIFSPEKSWILNRMMAKVLTGKWNKATESMDYLHTNKDIFKKVFKNGMMENAYAKGWRPSKRILMNVIDREMMDFHKENKHTVVLSSKVTSKTQENNEEVYYYESGVPLSLYKNLGEKVVEYYGDWEFYDIAVKKITADPWYEVRHCEHDANILAQESDILQPDYFIAPLSAEEKSWERYDFDKLFKVTSYKKLFNRLGDSFKLCDLTFGTHFFEELEELSAKEEALNQENQDTQDNATNDTPSDVLPEIDRKEPNPTSAPVEAVSTPPVATRGVRGAVSHDYKDTLIKAGFKGVESMSDQDVSLITGYDEINKRIIWGNISEAELLECRSCKVLAPEAVSSCPGCGIKF